MKICVYLVLKSSAANLELSIWRRMFALPMLALMIFREEQQWDLVRSQKSQLNSSLCSYIQW